MNKLLIYVLTASIIIFQNCETVKAQSADSIITAAEEYVCLPCGQDCDLIVKNSGGPCVTCHMQLVKKSSVVFKNLSPRDLYGYILKTGNSNIILLDVRTAEEFNGMAPEKFGRLKNAINIPVQQLEARIKELEAYKQKEIIVYCSHSHRSPAASYLLTQKGFKKVTNLQYGMHMWKQLVTDKKSNRHLYISQ
jgi:rhodanese-related sulfurtransferase/DNA-directed RNA polymerase subunit RPC12/RpoP